MCGLDDSDSHGVRRKTSDAGYVLTLEPVGIAVPCHVGYDNKGGAKGESHLLADEMEEWSSHLQGWGTIRRNRFRAYIRPKVRIASGCRWLSTGSGAAERLLCMRI